MFSEIITAFFNEGIPNYFISRKIDKSVELAQAQINTFYDEYRNNIFILAVLNGLFLIVSLISCFFTSIRMIGIIICFIMLLVLIGKSLYIIFQYIKKVIVYRVWINDFIKSFIKKRSFEKVIKLLLKSIWQNQYNIRTNIFTVKLHSILANTGIVKSVDEIEIEFIEKYYFMIREYIIGKIICKVSIIFVVFGIYVFFLQPLVIHWALGLKLTELLVYPARLFGLNSSNCVI